MKAGRELIMRAIERTHREALDPYAVIGEIWRYRSRDGLSDAELARQARRRLEVLEALL